ncbi:RNA polymerase sigma factor [Stieleria varia]|uniref:ECF RNA polymerase sigma factor SigE n=1 Tax=Stieleria varia TaxID=2528005 RepID=A0A5C6AZ94_9BACT|nr:sigma-70 family RNA polymerase sigma factor [Stieleria varia]TWU04797.1 ECF RNA polymerase sigma factor SigE [Stieleria varia]
MPQSPPETRASLILRLQNADDLAAWDEFTELYGPVVYRVARRRGFQAADAENLVQEVLLAVAQSISRWIKRDNRGSFHAWLLRIAHNEVVDMLTRPATRVLGQDGERGQELLDAISVRGDISSLIEREYERELFRWAADRVKQTVAPQTWQAFWLTEVNGQSVQQAAETIGTTAGQIYVNRSRVMARIKELIKEHEARK